MMKVQALDQGSAPILLSVHSLRQLGALMDFENDLAVFRHVDPTRVIQLERSSAGHQIMPLTEDVYQSAKQLARAVPSFKDGDNSFLLQFLHRVERLREQQVFMGTKVYNLDVAIGQEKWSRWIVQMV